MSEPVPSDPCAKRVAKWKTATALLIVLALVLSGILAYTYGYDQNRYSDLQSKDNSLQSNYDALKTLDAKNNQTITADNAKISGLEAQLDAANARIAYLQTQLNGNATLVASLRAQIASLSTQIAALNAQLADLEKANVIAYFQFQIQPSSCIIPIGNGCIGAIDGRGTLTAVAFANTGTQPASNVMLTVKFNDATGATLCFVTQSLAMVLKGQSIGALAGLDNRCDTGPYPISATTAVGTLTWS
jgi:hypothetical protein